MGNGGSTQRQNQYRQYPQHPYEQYSYGRNVESSDPYGLPSNTTVHNPRIVVHGGPSLDRTNYYEPQQIPHTRSQQQTSYSTQHHLATAASRTSTFPYECRSGAPTQRATQIPPPPPPPTPQTALPPPATIRNPIEKCTCRTCRQKEEALSAYATVSSAANTTYVAAQKQCTADTKVASRTAIPSNVSASCTSTRPAPTPAPYAMGYTTQQCMTMDQQRMPMDSYETSYACGAPNCRGHTADTFLEPPISTSTNQRSCSYGPQSTSRVHKKSMSKQNVMHIGAHPSSYDGISQSGAAPADIISEFHQECLEAHNRFRARHKNCPPLSLSIELSQYAQQWAKHLANTGRLEHRQVHTYGENLYTARGMEVSGASVVQSWYDEIRYYDFSKPNYKPGTGHFTQIVWRESRQLGVGVVTKGDTTYVVCNYNPPGNIIGSFESMVPQLKCTK
ncbi:uncharacterized protein [Eurosta solidaginis]|uniref:uncharacterized protein n=1 Tax=Eurosta solidaginis TaxID=178769 RepID=UPI003530FE83